MSEPQVADALEAIRPPVGFEPDWDDVLRRGRPARRRRALALAGCVAAVAVAVTPALGLRGKLAPFFSLASSPHPAQSWRLAGAPARVTPEVRAAARLTHVRVGSLRRVVAAGTSFRRVALLAGIGPDGAPWTGQSGPGWASGFFPLFGEVGETSRASWRTRTPHGWDGWRFPMYARSDRDRALFDYVAFGGARAASVDWTTLVGFARSGVTRVVVVTASGRRVPLRLTAGGGYGYAAVRPADLPRRVLAYAGDRLAGVELVAPAPLD